MNQKEWLDYFETINDRKPTPEELQEALVNGDFVASEGAPSGGAQPEVLAESVVAVDKPLEATQSVAEPLQAREEPLPEPKKPMSKKAKLIISVVTGVFALLLVSLGGFVAWTYQSGKIPDGTYQLSEYRYYDDDKEKMVDGLTYFKENNMEMLDFIKVSGNKLKSSSYMKSGSVQLVSAMDYETDSELIANPWSHTLNLAWTLSEYTQIVDDVLEKQYRNFDYASSSDIKASRDAYIESYKSSLKLTYRYNLKGDELTLTTYNKKGQIDTERVFKRLSQEKTKKLDFDYNKAVRQNKELYKS